MARKALKSSHDPATVPTLSNEFGIGVRTIRAGIDTGDLPAYYVGNTKWPRVFRDDFVDWMRSNRVPSPARNPSHLEGVANGRS